MASNLNESENLCVVCFKDTEIYSIGECDHPVCFECSTRMRVLCDQKECPICRGDMPKVYFTNRIQLYAELIAKHPNPPLYDKKYGLYFLDTFTQKAYQKLLEYRCVQRECQSKTNIFPTFQSLKDHMRREHAVAYCDLCVENLKIFPSERRCYNRQEMGYHRRKGDPDDKSHRGHPLCQFCDTRFMDRDDLFRHMRRNHFYCHFCDADGKHQYYDTIENLRKHFAHEHYLCEEGECKAMPLVAVFRTDIDLKAHVASEHRRNLSKSANKQARTLELEFTLAPRRGRRMDEETSGYDHEPGGPGGGGAANNTMHSNPLTLQDFPALGGNSGANNNLQPYPRPTTTLNFTSKINPFSGEDFPCLGGNNNNRSSNVTITTNTTTNAKRKPEVTIIRTVRDGFERNREDFPRLGGNTTNPTSTVKLSVNNSQNASTPKVSIQFNHNANGAAITTHITTTKKEQLRNNEAFPPLKNENVPVERPQWVVQQSKPKKPTTDAKAAKIAPAPRLPPTDLSQFPQLTRTNDESKTKSKKKKTKSALNEHDNNNGVVKKRSELQIGNLNINENNALVKPPPGINVKPPPGFTVDDFPKLGAGNGMTFTSSSGLSYAIEPTFHSPPNFVQRNQNLSKRFKEIVNSDERIVMEFKCLSDRFRNGDLPSDKYYTHCKRIFGKYFDEIFPELLVLLPDIEKQQDLYRVHSVEHKCKKLLTVCDHCKQVIYKKEMDDHLRCHMMDHQFPSLGAKPWRKC